MDLGNAAVAVPRDEYEVLATLSSWDLASCRDDPREEQVVTR
jgi:hypothetical protein